MANVKLSFGAILSESFRFFFGNLRIFFHLVTIPWIVSLVLRILGSMIDEDSLPVILLEKAVDIVPTIMFMVAWMRLVLLGPNGVGRLPGTGWGARETAFLIHLLKIGAITFLLLAAFALTVGSIDPAMLGGGLPLDPEMAKREALAAPFGTGFMVSALVALAIVRAIGAGSAAAIIVWTAAILVSYGGAAVGATAQALVFRALTGWRNGAPAPS